VVAAADGDFTATLQSGKVPAPLAEALAAADVQLSPLTLVKPRLSGEGWYLWDRDGQDRLALSADAAGVEARVWDQWYEYDGEFGVSYWFSERKQGVDLGEESRLAYAFHMLLGHHGLFPLTPIWLLSVAGIAIWMVRREDRMQGVGLMFLGLSLLILAFYIARPMKDRNYGGVCCGLRWIFWLIPLWTLALLPACDWIAQRRGLRYLALGLLLGSAISSAYASLNPWTHPWIYAYWQYLEWVPGVK
jgi:hypothetical protein